MSIRVLCFRAGSVFISVAVSFIAIFAFTIITAQPAAAQSRVVQKWIATVNNPVNATHMMNLVNDAAADSNGNIFVGGNICVALQSNGQCANQEFQIEAYNSSGQRIWGSSIAASFPEDTNTAVAVAVDPSNDVYAAGNIFNTPPANETLPTESMIIVKYSASGSREWIRYYGYYQNSSYNCAVQAITTDQQNNLYVTGWCNGSGGLRVQTLKYSASGQLLWIGTFTSITDYDGLVHTDFLPKAIAVYDSTDVYVAGWVGGPHPVTLKYDQAGNLVWQRMADGSIASWGEPDTAHSLALDSAGNIYEEGTGWNGISSAYALKYDGSGNLLWLTQAQEPDCTKGDVRATTVGNTIGLDLQGNVYLTSNDCNYAVMVNKFNTNGGSLWQAEEAASPNVFVIASYVNHAGDIYALSEINLDFQTIKYDSNGNEQWVVSYAGTSKNSNNLPTAITASGANLYITGSTGSATLDGPSSWVTIDYVQDAADATPTSVTFSSQAIDTTSAAQAVTLKNTSTEDLDIRGITMSGPFSETNNCSSMMVGGGSCMIEVRFTPTSTGTQTGSLSISDQWAGSPDVVSLSGTGAP